MEIQRNISLSEQLKRILLERIRTRHYPAGTRFPSESELCQEFGLSRATVRSVMAELTARGLLVRQAGVGTFLASSSQLETGLERLESVISIAHRCGGSASTHDLAVRELRADANLSQHLCVPAGAPVSQISRAIEVDGRRVSYHEDYLAAGILPAEPAGLIGGSVLDWLVACHPHPITNAKTEITAVSADQRLGRFLSVPAGSALIWLKETLHDETGAVVSYSDNYFVPDRFALQFVRRR